MTRADGTTAIPASWWARGLLFENCNCQTVCPGHVHFSQLCTHERCVGYWAIRFDEGRFGPVDLAGVRTVIGYDSPRHMVDGDWIQTLIVDDGASPEQRDAIEAILDGRAGGPWAKLAPFVGTRVPTRSLPIRIDGADAVKRIEIDGVGESTVTPIRGRDRSKPVTFTNMFNQIHATEQVVATGETRYDDGTVVVVTEGTHGLYSSFEWRVAPDGS